MYTINKDNTIDIDGVNYRYVNDIDVSLESTSSRIALAKSLDASLASVSLTETKRNAALVIRAIYATKFNEQTSKYTSYESDYAFNVQYHEYNAWLSNIKAKTPYVDGILSVTNDTKVKFFGRLEAKLAYLGKLHGDMMKLEASVDACTTTQEVDIILDSLT